jgi:LPS export ABC transporter protein LptC
VILSNFHRSETKDGKKQWELFADGGEYSPAGGTISVSNSRLTLFRPDGTSVLMTAPASTIEITGQDLKSAVSRGGVVITYSEGMVIKTEETTYNREAGTVYAPHRVVIEGESGVTEGDWLKGDVATKVMNLGGDIKTRINSRPTPTIPQSSGLPSQPAQENK